MASWNDVADAAPDLAAAVQARFDATGLGFLATVRADGSPRISGIEPLFALGEIWLGMMPGSRKDRDLQRDPRLALHSASVDKQVTEGDAKLTGRAVPVDDETAFARYVAAFTDHAGAPPPPGPFPVYRVEVDEVSFLRPAGDHLEIDIWSERKDGAAGARRVERS